MSAAVGSERVSRVVGYIIAKGDFRTSTPNLPQRIALLGEANTANQATLDISPFQLTSAQQAGERYGWGSPLHLQARILLPKGGGGIGGIPLIVYPQVEAVGATNKILQVSATGTAIKNGTHTLVIAGREGYDGNFYNIPVVIGDSTDEISTKVTDAVNNMLASPFIAVDMDYNSELTSKWKGETADRLSVTVDTNGDDCGLTYVVDEVQSAAGTPSIADALDAIGNDWITIVENPYEDTQIMQALEIFNGIPDPINPTGRYVGIVMKPFIAITGSVEEDPSSITDARLNDVTIAIAPAPLSPGLPMEAAANMVVLFANVSQNTPHLDVAGQPYPDMPVPTAIGAMADYNNRDVFVKRGCSTVTLETGRYMVQDFVTTYHPVGEEPPQYRYPRNLMLDFNVRYGYLLLEQINVVDHAIAADEDIVTASKVVKPKMWIQILNTFAKDLAKRGLIVQVAFMTDSIKVGLSTSNPDRLETKFSYKRSGFARISDTEATAGFNFGVLN